MNADCRVLFSNSEERWGLCDERLYFDDDSRLVCESLEVEGSIPDGFSDHPRGKWP